MWDFKIRKLAWSAVLGAAWVGQASFALADATTAPAAAGGTTAAATVADSNAALTPASDFWQEYDAWTKDIRKPLPWWSLGADLRLREKYLKLAQLRKLTGSSHERSLERYRARLWSTFTPMENLEIGVRLMYEGRHYAKPDAYNEWYNSPVYIDQLYVKVKKVAELPLTVTVGRQDIKLGDGWLVNEGTPLDGSRTAYFDAVRATYDIADISTTVDAIGILQYSQSNAWLPTINDDRENQIEQDERAMILWVTNKSIQDTEINPYFIYYHGDAEKTPLVAGSGGTPIAVGNIAAGVSSEIYTFGTRVVHQFDPHWKLSLEGAGQFGSKSNADLLAFGTRNLLTYLFKDEHDIQIRGGYEYLSGNDPSTSTNEAFDPLWGRWPQWSDYIPYIWSVEQRTSEATNMHRFQVGASVAPVKDMLVSLDLHYLLTDQNRVLAGISPTGDSRGFLIVSRVAYKFNQHLATAFTGEMFWPGDYYVAPRDGVGTFLRLEVVYTF